MHPPLRQTLNFTKSILPEGPLICRLPIGQAQKVGPTTSRRFSVPTSQAASKALKVKRWRSATKAGAEFRQFSDGTRSRGAWEGSSNGPATFAKRSNTAPLLGVLFGASALAYLGSSVVSHVDVHDDSISSRDGVNITDAEDVRKIRLAEIPKHNRDASRKWIIRETGVYDITDFVQQHPGGEVILRACGGSVDPYWKIFSIHQKPEVYDILKEFHIGEIDERDLDDAGHVDWSVLGAAAADHVIDDPFKHDPVRDDSLIVRTAKPCNAETPGNLLTDFLTPLRLFFVRNHFWVPQTHESPQSVTVELSDGEERTFSLPELKQKFKEHTITVTLQCSGNRRSHMSKASRPTAGLQWDVGAIGTAEFSGVRLRDVLRDSGCCVQDDCPAPNQCEDEDADRHVHFSSPGDAYAVSIPLQTALNPQADVLLAWSMNGEPINRDHGGPLRAIVPGITAARSVKWLGRVSISSEEAQSQWQARDYKCFGPNIKQTDVTGEDWDAAQSMQESPVQSAITNIIKASAVDQTTIQGFAFSGGGRAIVRVDVSADGGQTWKQAQLHKDRAKGSKRWAWTLWSIDWPKDETRHGNDVKFIVKATDEAYNTQPQSFDSTWNFRGLCANAWHSLPAPKEAI